MLSNVLYLNPIQRLTLLKASLVTQHIQQIAPIAVVFHLLGQAFDLLGADEPLPEGDFLDAGNLQSLTLFDGLDEGGRLHKALVGAGVQPSDAPAEFFHR